MRSLTVDECSVVSGGLLRNPFDDVGAFDGGLLSAVGLGDLAYLLKKGGGKCVTATTDSNGVTTVNIIADCSGGSSGSSSGSWIGGTFLAAGAIGATAGMVWGGSVAVGHAAGTGFLAPLLLAEGVYAGGMLGLTVGLAAGAVIVGGILIAGGIYYAVTYSNTGR